MDNLSPRIRDSSDLEILKIGSATYANIQDWINITQSAGLISGGVVSDAGGATVDVAGGTGFIKATDDHVAPSLSFDFSASLGLAIPADTIRYVVVDYNAGTPEVQIDITDSIDSHTRFRLATIVNESGTLHILNNPSGISDVTAHISERFYETFPRQRANREGGLILGESGTRNLTLSAGKIYDALNEFDISAIDTSVSGTFDSYSSSGKESSANTQWDNDNYDNAGTLTSLSNNRFAILWLYVELDGPLVCVYGTSQYTSSASAENESAPAVLPLRIQAHSVLVGRIIFQKGAASASEIQSAFSTSFQPTLSTDHNNLSNLTIGDPHTQYQLIAGRPSDITIVPDATYIVLATDRLIHTTYTPTGPITSITIPTALLAAGKKFVIVDGGGNAGTNNITINTEGTAKIIGQSNYLMNTNYESKTFYTPDGTNWFFE
ncbi:hypothetical protein KAR91_34885 [Candidatus Pacearchaeota archaeon]|nr:hypothetical protein [Candidatus Pacearchaeota archaeon]